MQSTQKSRGFTLVELAIAIAVIGILASITIIGYGTWRRNTAINVLKSDLNGAVAAMEDARNADDGYPAAVPDTFHPSDEVVLAGGSTDGKTFCLSTTSTRYPDLSFYVTDDNTTPQAGTCDDAN